MNPDSIRKREYRPRTLEKQTDGPKEILSPEEQDALLAQFNTRYASPHRNLCMVRLMLEAGLRVGEVVALRPEHLNMTTCRLEVREGKGAKDRPLCIGDDLRDLIGDWLERRAEGSRWLFPTSRGTQLCTSYVRRMVKRMARRAGVAEADRVSSHVLRHTFASDKLNEGCNVRTVQLALGHANLNTTMIYTHVADGQLKEAMRGSTQPDADGDAGANDAVEALVAALEGMEDPVATLRDALARLDR